MKYQKIIWQKDESSDNEEKKKVEALIKRLNDKIHSNPEMIKKASLIIESWLKKKSRP